MNRSSVIVGKKPLFGWVVWLVVAMLACIVVGYLMYDLGLSRAGFRSSAAAAEINKLQEQVAALTGANKAFSEQVAVLETAAKIDREAYRQVEAKLGELQSKIIAQQEDVEFYRGIVGEGDGSELRIQSFQISPGLREQEFELHLVLAQAMRASREVAGKIDVQLEGLQRNKTVMLGLAELQGGTDTLAYKFRYFQDFTVDIVLPADIEPRRVRVRVQPRGRGKSAKTVEEFFAWQPENG